MNGPAFAPRRHQSPTLPALFALAAAVLLSGCRTEQPAVGESTPKSPPRAAPAAIGGLGRIEPGDGIVRIAARSLGGQASIVKQLLVREGDMVKAGQVIAELDSKEQLQAATAQAAARIEVTRRRLAQSQMGAKPSDMAAQEADIERLQFELENARKEHQRFSALGDNVTAAELDRLTLRIESTTRALAAARQRLASLSEIRAVDTDVARAELEEAVLNEARTRAELDASVIHSPIDGRIIKIYAWPGAAVPTEGLLEVAPTEPMYAIAEVPEADISRVKVGQRATISGDGLKDPLQGTVDRIGVKVLQNQVMPVDPANFSDARVVEVWVKVDDSRAVADLIHLRVDVLIQP